MKLTRRSFLGGVVAAIGAAIAGMTGEAEVAEAAPGEKPDWSRIHAYIDGHPVNDAPFLGHSEALCLHAIDNPPEVCWGCTATSPNECDCCDKIGYPNAVASWDIAPYTIPTYQHSMNAWSNPAGEWSFIIADGVHYEESTE